MPRECPSCHRQLQPQGFLIGAVICKKCLGLAKKGRIPIQAICGRPSQSNLSPRPRELPVPVVPPRGDEPRPADSRSENVAHGSDLAPEEDPVITKENGSLKLQIQKLNQELSTLRIAISAAQSTTPETLKLQSQLQAAETVCADRERRLGQAEKAVRQWQEVANLRKKELDESNQEIEVWRIYHQDCVKKHNVIYGEMKKQNEAGRQWEKIAQESFYEFGDRERLEQWAGRYNTWENKYQGKIKTGTYVALIGREEPQVYGSYKEAKEKGSQEARGQKWLLTRYDQEEEPIRKVGT